MCGVALPKVALPTKCREHVTFWEVDWERGGVRSRSSEVLSVEESPLSRKRLAVALAATGRGDKCSVGSRGKSVLE